MNDLEIAVEYKCIVFPDEKIRKQHLIVFHLELTMEKEATKRNRINISSKVNSYIIRDTFSTPPKNFEHFYPLLEIKIVSK